MRIPPASPWALGEGQNHRLPKNLSTFNTGARQLRNQYDTTTMAMLSLDRLKFYCLRQCTSKGG